jgi:xanthine dehydrogenase accessory factor
MPTNMEILLQATHLLENGKKLAFCTVIDKKGSGPRSVGAKMLVEETGETFGTIGGGTVERTIVNECLKSMMEGKSKSITFNLSKAPKIGKISTEMICGGELTVFIDVLEPTPRLIIVGAGNISLPLATFASISGFKVTIIDDEQKLANKKRFPMADAIVAGNFDQVLASFPLCKNDYAVIAHGEPEHDYMALKCLIDRGARYIGLLGSRTKVALLTERLREDGKAEHYIKSLHAPLGLDIGAETPEEISISILAEMVKYKNSIN